MKLPIIPFVETSVARLIFDVIDEARELRQCAAVVGAPGIGKTLSLQAYKESHPATVSITVTAVLGGSLSALLEVIAARLSIYRVQARSLASLQSSLLSSDLEGQCMILDEAQNLTLKALREILYINDYAGLSIIFVGNQEVLKRVSIDTGAFAQISRRVPRREKIDGITPADADLIASWHGVEGLEAFALLRVIAETFHADGVSTLIRSARQFNGGGNAIRLPHLLDALKDLPSLMIAVNRARIAKRAAKAAFAA